MSDYQCSSIEAFVDGYVFDAEDQFVACAFVVEIVHVQIMMANQSIDRMDRPAIEWNMVHSADTVVIIFIFGHFFFFFKKMLKFVKF